MFSSEQLNDILKELQSQLSTQDTNYKNKINEGRNKPTSLTTTQILAILALLAGTMEVTSVVIDRNQSVQLVLSGTLKKNEKSPLDEVMTQLGNCSFDEVMKAMLGRFK